jgi:hypothetical protein
VAEEVVDLLEAVESRKRTAMPSARGLEVSSTRSRNSARSRGRGEVVEGGVDELVLEHLSLADVSRVEHDPPHARLLSRFVIVISTCTGGQRLADLEVEDADPYDSAAISRTARSS